MCGRFTLTADAAAIATLFGLADIPPISPRYNIAPTQPVPVIRQLSAASDRKFGLLQWGLIPSWAKDTKIGSRLINARAETAAEKPSFRSALRRRRCLVLADGFYEWQRQQQRKQPYYICLRDARPFAFAGLWEHWQDRAGATLETCTILTTAANELVAPIHNRMPVILAQTDHDRWLDPVMQNPQHLKPLFRPYPADQFSAFPVSDHVNNPHNDDPGCLERLSQ